MFVFVSELVLLDYSNIVYIYTHAHACVSPYVFTCVHKNLFHLVTCRKTDILPQLLDAKQPKRQCDVIKRRDASRQHQNDAIPLLSPPYKGCFIRKKRAVSCSLRGMVNVVISVGESCRQAQVFLDMLNKYIHVLED